jgi:hypothetical protein
MQYSELNQVGLAIMFQINIQDGGYAGRGFHVRSDVSQW